MTKSTTAPTVESVLAKCQAELAEIEIRRIRAEEEADACLVRINVITNRVAAIHAAMSTMKGIAPIEPDQAWRDQLIGWRRTLCDELRALPSPIRDSRTQGLQANLVLSVRTIDLGTDVSNGSGYDLTNLRLGALMRNAGYEPIGADPDRRYGGVMPWHGSLPEIERRIARIEKERADAEAVLAEALLDDAERERRAADDRKRIAAENAKPVRKIRADGSMYERQPDGRMVEIAS